MNSTLIFVLCIVAIYYTADTVQKIIRARADRKGSDTELEDTLLRIDELEERIRVLERIVTENKYDLRSEINRL
ncbi:MAG: hypothetical protein IIA11_00410 [Proteobacteria bacterium]|nr:hypothetical protein [Pseudomonadota bacterium]